MKTFLPSGYSFGLDKLVNQQLVHQLMHPVQDLFFNSNNHFVLIILISIIIFVFFCLTINMYAWLTNLSEIKVYGSIVFVLCAMIVALGLTANTLIDRSQAQYFNANFKYPGPQTSNLQIRMTDHLKPTTTHDHKVYPYKLYSQNNIYLGQVQHGKFKPATTDAAATFYKYYTYMIKNKLTDKFTNNISFEKDGKYLSNNGHAQWILTNKKNFVLHLDDNARVQESTTNN